MRRLLLPIILLIGFCLSAWATDQGQVPSPVPSDYTIGIGDVLSVIVWGEEGLSRSVAVRPDGKITVPLINDVRVAGSSSMEAGERIAKRLIGLVNEPRVAVIVDEINSFKVYILGTGVNSQGVFTFRQPTRVLQALAYAGGVSPSTNNEILIIRESGSASSRIEVDLMKLLSGDPTEGNIFLKPGDTIVIH